MRLQYVANSEFGEQQRVWTQLLAIECRDKEQLSEDEEAKITATMLDLGYVNLQIHSKSISVLLERGEYSREHPSIIMLIEKVDDMSSSPQNTLNYVGMLVREAWKQPLVDDQKSLLMGAILMKVREIPYGRVIIKALQNNLENIFGLDVINENSCRDFIKAWGKSQIL